tara:strand:+ start:393 stop:1022 length:630 start_codon:yes stop_codon:yes gene_type:complete
MKLTIPDKLSDITLAQFRQIEQLDDSGDLYWVRTALSILTELEPDQIDLLSVGDMERIGDILGRLFSYDDDDVPLQNIIEYQGQTYGFHPNLTNITVGEWADLEQLLDKGWLENMGAVLSILYRPVTIQTKHEYKIAPYVGYGEEAEEVWADLTMDVVLGAVAFFLHTASVLAIAFNSSSMDKAEARLSPTSGGGTLFSTLWRKVTRSK